MKIKAIVTDYVLNYNYIENVLGKSYNLGLNYIAHFKEKFQQRQLLNTFMISEYASKVILKNVPKRCFKRSKHKKLKEFVTILCL